MNEAERIWSDKSDEDLLEAAADLGQFTEGGQRIIRAELKRRGFEDPVEQVVAEGGEAPEEEAEEPECLRCHVPLLLIDPDDEKAVARWPWLLVPGGLGVFGALSALDALNTGQPANRGLDVYICPRCGHLDLFAEPPEEAEGAGPEAQDPS